MQPLFVSILEDGICVIVSQYLKMHAEYPLATC